MGIPSWSTRDPWRDYLAVALLSLAALSLEISLTRVLSLVEWYHFAFMVVSIALFGYGAAGTLLFLLPGIRKAAVTPALSAALCCATIALSMFFASSLRFDPIEANARPILVGVIALQYITLGLPFFFTGICIATLVTKNPSRANFIYFSDLTGAGIGTILALLVMPLAGPHGAILTAAIFAAVAWVLLGGFEGSPGVMGVGGLAALSLLVASTLCWGYEPGISEYKALSAVMRYPDAERVLSRWNAISRIDVIRSNLVHHAPGLPFDRPMPLPEQMALTIDGDNMEPITRFDGNISSLDFMLELPSAVAYAIAPRDSVLVLDAGGGFDVLVALRNGAERIVAVEQNPTIVETVKVDIAEFAGAVYGWEGVEVRVGDPRNYLSAAEETFDLIEVSLKQDVVTASTGLHSLSESYLLTVEAFRAAYRALNEEGVLAVTRWLSPPPREGPRVASLCVQTLTEEGVLDPGAQIAAFRSYVTITILMKKTSFTIQELSALRSECSRRSLDLVYLPDMTVEEANRINIFESPDYFNAFVGVIHEGKPFLDEYFFKLTPPTDERPFYNDFIRWGTIWKLREALGPAWNPYLDGGLLVAAVLLQAAAISVLLILLPVWLAARSGKGARGRGRWVLYFLCLGAGYIMVEVALLQRFILVLGQPAYAMAAVLFGMLVFSGLGSLWSSRAEPSAPRLSIAILSIILLLVIGYVCLKLLAPALLGLHPWLKFPISIGLLAPLAFAMGVPFPMGIRVLGWRRREDIPLAYSSNGCASVVGSAGSLMLAGWLGHSNVLLVCAAIYTLALLTIRRTIVA